MRPASDAQRGWPLAVLCLLTLALKLCVIFAPPRELWPDGKGMDEELWRGTSAMELIEGPLLPFFDHQVNDFSGGSLVVALIDVPLFLLLGPTLAVMRLATIPFHLLGVVALFLLLDRWVGRRAAWAGGLLLALPPPGYAIVSATAWGTHMEGIALGLLLTGVWLEFQAARPRSSQAAFLLGSIAGFAVYFGYVAVVLIAALALVEVARERMRVFDQTLIARAAGFALGFAPWIAYNATHAFGGLTPYNRGLGERVQATGELGPKLSAGLDFVSSDQASALHLPDSRLWSGATSGLVLYAQLVLLAVAGAVAFWRLRRREPGAAPHPVHPAALALAYLPLFVAAYVLSDFRIKPPAIQDYRYALPLYPWLLVLLATAVQHAEHPRLRRAFQASVAILALAFTCGTIARCDFEHARPSWSHPGSSDTVLARTLFLKHGTNQAMLTRVLTRLAARPLERQHQTLFVLGQNYKQMLRPETRYGPRTPPRELYASTLEFLQATISQPFNPYFATPVQGERGYKPSQRELFWKDWNERHP